jgi:hypothetical protein
LRARCSKPRRCRWTKSPAASATQSPQRCAGCCAATRARRRRGCDARRSLHLQSSFRQRTKCRQSWRKQS